MAHATGASVAAPGSGEQPHKGRRQAGRQPASQNAFERGSSAKSFVSGVCGSAIRGKTAPAGAAPKCRLGLDVRGRAVRTRRRVEYAASGNLLGGASGPAVPTGDDRPAPPGRYERPHHRRPEGSEPGTALHRAGRSAPEPEGIRGHRSSGCDTAPGTGRVIARLALGQYCDDGYGS